MTIKLTRKTIQMYLAVSVSVFLISIPVFYQIVQKLWIKDVDESMLYQKEKIISGLGEQRNTSETIHNFNALSSITDNGITIKELRHMVYKADSIYYHLAYDSVRKHVEPYRELTSYVVINNVPYQITLKRDLVESEDLLAGIVAIQLGLFILLLVMILGISYGFYRRTWSPFFEITRKLKDVEIDKPCRIDVDCKNIFEFEDLKSSVNELILHNHNLFLSQKEFIENASHEIQTPLAVIKSQLDILSNSPSITPRQMECVVQVNNQIRYMVSINRNLLFLAKLDNRQFPLDETVDVTAILMSYYDHIKEEVHLAGKEIIIDKAPLTIGKCNTVLLMSLFNNLINNAVKHSSPHNVIQITLQEDHLEIKNAGINKALPAEYIFNRFYKKESNSNGAGLGLSIVAQICNILNYKITYRFNEPNQHSFVVWFK